MVTVSGPHRSRAATTPSTAAMASAGSGSSTAPSESCAATAAAESTSEPPDLCSAGPGCERKRACREHMTKQTHFSSRQLQRSNRAPCEAHDLRRFDAERGALESGLRLGHARLMSGSGQFRKRHCCLWLGTNEHLWICSVGDGIGTGLNRPQLPCAFSTRRLRQSLRHADSLALRAWARATV